MDALLGTIAGILPVVIGAVIGLALIRLGNRRRRAIAGPPATGTATAPQCSCGHGLNYHNAKSSRCHAGVRGARLSNYNEEGDGTYIGERYAIAQCACQRYIGPDIMPSVWAQPTQLPQPTINRDKD